MAIDQLCDDPEEHVSELGLDHDSTSLDVVHVVRQLSLVFLQGTEGRKKFEVRVGIGLAAQHKID